MKYVFKDLSDIKRRLNKSNFALLLDFDLTLSPLAKNPTKAILPEDTRILIKKLSKYIHIAVITGRTINDIKKRIKLNNITYVGNHGLEYEVGGVVRSTRLSTGSQKGLKNIKKKFLDIKRKYSGVFVEDKKLTLALHYRLLLPQDKSAFVANIKKIQTEIKNCGLRKILYKKTLEVRTKAKENKGTASLFILKEFNNPKQVIYIGDGKTDEDAFHVLPQDITIRVGKSKHSFAKYYVRNTKEVKKFLVWLLSTLNH